MTPGARVVSCAALRPFSGSSFTRAVSTTCESVPVVVSTCGTSVVTVTVEVAVPHLERRVHRKLPGRRAEQCHAAKRWQNRWPENVRS